MKQMEIQKVDDPPLVTVAVAVSGSKRSNYAVRWALDKFIPEGKVQAKLLHVRSRIVRVPTEMGSYLPISQVREDVATAYRKEVEWRTNEMLIPYKKICAQREVEAEIIVVEADDVAQAISETIAKLSIRKLVLSASSRNAFTRKIGSSKMSFRISRLIPSFCTVYVVSKGQLLSVRAHTSAVESSKVDNDSSITSGSFTSHSSSSKSESETTTYISTFESSQCMNTDHCISEASCVSSSSSMPDSQLSSLISSSIRSFKSEIQAYNPDDVSRSENARDFSTVEGQDMNVSLELEKLRIELRRFKEVYLIAQNESIDAKHQMRELSARLSDEAANLEEAKLREAKAMKLVLQERERKEASRKEADFVKQCAQEEAIQRREAEDNAIREDTEKQRLEKVLAYNDEPFMKYAWEDIELATMNRSESLKLGVGANGVVYKAKFHHTTAAVKILHSIEADRDKQFKQELEILGRIRHPHLLLLLGACTEQGCLVYEYMENGSLDDRLRRKNGTPPLPWYYRFRIAWEIASALAFLHNTKPQPIIHRDLKPANILLDENFVSKIGDVGLSTLVSSVDPTTMSYKDTAPIGTICYIDPEYQRSGQVSPKSDVYALGIVILELLTGKSPMGLAYIVERAIEEGSLMDILDSEAGRWPVKEAQELAHLGLGCTELKRKDRPDLKQYVIPRLEKLKELADKACDVLQGFPSDPPSHFICPILQEVMDDPCVALDGYTYERRAIEYWFGFNDKSPMTNAEVIDKNLIPNHALRSAIKDWKPRRC